MHSVLLMIRIVFKVGFTFVEEELCYNNNNMIQIIQTSRSGDSEESYLYLTDVYCWAWVIHSFIYFVEGKGRKLMTYWNGK